MKIGGSGATAGVGAVGGVRAVAGAGATTPTGVGSPSACGRREAPAPDPELLGKLTRREVEILRLVSEGLSNRQVGEILYVTDQTVKFHLANVYRKLGVGSRLEAGRWAREQGLLDGDAVPNVVALPQPQRLGLPEADAVVVPLLQGVAVTEAGETSR